MPFVFTYTAAVLTIIFVVTAAFLFLKGKRDDLTFVFIFYILSSAVWMGGNAAADISYTHNTLILTSGIAFIGGTFLATAFLIFVDTFIDGRLPSPTRLLLYFLPSLLFTIFSFSEYAIVETLFPPNQPAQIIPGFQYQLAFFWLVSSLFYGLIRLIKEASDSRGRRHMQTLYIIVGFSALLIGEITFSVLLPLLGELRFFNVAPQFSLIFLIASAYAIYRHNLLDIRVVVQKGLIYTFLLIGIVGTYLVFLNIFGIFLQHLTETASIISAAVTTIIGIFTVPPIENYLRIKTDAFFFKNRYDYATALYGLSNKIKKIILVDDIIKTGEESLREIFKTQSVRISVVGVDNINLLESDPNRTNIIVPIVHDDKLIGSIFLGEKLSGDPYTKEDMVLVGTFSHQIAVAFEKARLYKEVLDYSESLEKKVAERTKQVETLQRDQERMMLDIAHKLQNPLTIIKGELSLLSKHLPQKTDILFFEKTIDDVSAFIYDLMRLARIEMAPEFLHKESQNLSDHVLELIEYFDTVTKQNNIKLRHQIEPNIFFEYHKVSITELVTNLVSNAVKYIGKQTEGITKTITLSLSHQADAIVLTVSDNGIGIPARDLPRIFERFYRTNDQQHTAIGGTGLGLAICKKIAEIHNGTIEVQSENLKGSTFTVTFRETL